MCVAGRGHRGVGHDAGGHHPPQRHAAAGPRPAGPLHAHLRQEHPPQAHARARGARRTDRQLRAQEGLAFLLHLEGSEDVVGDLPRPLNLALLTSRAELWRTLSFDV